MPKLKHGHTFDAKMRVRGWDWLATDARSQVPTASFPSLHAVHSARVVNDADGQSSLDIFSCQ